MVIPRSQSVQADKKFIFSSMNKVPSIKGNGSDLKPIKEAALSTA